MARPVILDLYSGAGGAARGYQRAGFYVVGVDLQPQPRYAGDEFMQADAIEVLEAGLDVSFPGLEFDAIHASPPCQAYSRATLDHSRHPDLYAPTRELLEATGVPWVIENVLGAPYRHGIVLCGSMFGMRVQRHRNFETSFFMWQPQCDHSGPRPYTVTGHLTTTEQDYPHSLKPTQEQAKELMGMPWATWEECVLAIPPTYTRYIGEHLLQYLGMVAA